MYEDQTYDIILERMMNRVSDKIDKRPSSPVYDLHSSTAIEFQILYIELEYLIKNSYGDTAAREFLILLAKDRGLSPEPATKAILQGEFTPTNIDVTGKRFNIGEINYVVTEQITPGTYKVQCETEGVVGNQYLGDMIPMEYIDGLQTASLTSVLIPGEDEEDTELFRQRYLNSLNAQAFGGNQIDYIEKVNAIPGVGGVKVYRAWNGDLKPANMIPPKEAEAWIEGLSGVPEPVKLWLDTVYAAAKNNMFTVGGTVKLVVINSTFTVPSPTLVEQVQTAVDPLQNAGEGVGIAPIGHVVRVEGVQEETVDLGFALYYQRGWSWEDVSGYVTEAINGYFLELAQSWADQDEALVVRISQIESRLLGITGILDIANTTINEKAANHTLALDHIPVLGSLAPTTIEIKA